MPKACNTRSQKDVTCTELDGAATWSACCDPGQHLEGLGERALDGGVQSCRSPVLPGVLVPCPCSGQSQSLLGPLQVLPLWRASAVAGIGTKVQLTSRPKEGTRGQHSFAECQDRATLPSNSWSIHVLGCCCVFIPFTISPLCACLAAAAAGAGEFRAGADLVHSTSLPWLSHMQLPWTPTVENSK